MQPVREPILKPVPLAQLRPTQITLGMREVEIRRKSWRETKKISDDAFFASHMIPVVLGPKDRRYVIDHHHLARGLIEEEVKAVLTTIVADLRHLSQEAFWIFLDNRGWMHPFDSKGRRRSYDDIPKSISEMVDDPFRSLAGELRRIGGFAKDTTPFSEFLWADFLRRRIKVGLVKRHFDQALKKALQMARDKEANYLPGWCGSVTEA
jgi:hypothetical protein